MKLKTGIGYANIQDSTTRLLGDDLKPDNIEVSFGEFIANTANATWNAIPLGNLVDAYQKTNAMRSAGELREADPFEQYLAGNATYYAEGKVKDFTKDEYRMSKEAWEKSQYYRREIDYREDMTETLAKILSEDYDNHRYRDALLNMRAENNTGLGQAMDTAAGFVTAMGVSIVDPINWLPFARALGVGTKVAGTVGKTFWQGAKAGAFEGAVSMAIGEAIVYDRQRALGEKSHTVQDAVFNTAMSAVLGGLIGGAVRSYKFSKMTPEQRALAEQGVDQTGQARQDTEILLTDVINPLQEKADQFFLDLNFSDPKTLQFYSDMMPEASLADLIDLFALATHDVESGIKIDVVDHFLNNERLLNDIVRTYNVASLMGMHKNAPDLTLENFKEFLRLEKKKASDQLNAELNTTEKEAKINQDLEANTANTKTDDTNETTTEEAKTEEAKTDTEATTENTDAGKTEAKTEEAKTEEAKTEEVKTDTQGRKFVEDREDFTLEEQRQIYDFEDQVKALHSQKKIADQDLDEAVNQFNKTLDNGDKIKEASLYIMDCIKGAV